VELKTIQRRLDMTNKPTTAQELEDPVSVLREIASEVEAL